VSKSQLTKTKCTSHIALDRASATTLFFPGHDGFPAGTLEAADSNAATSGFDSSYAAHKPMGCGL